jgi:hypothetical protein
MPKMPHIQFLSEKHQVNDCSCKVSVAGCYYIKSN